jgi:acyl-CoA thioester hydrolase
VASGTAGPSRAVQFDLEIYTFDIDFAGHVSNITYVRWLEIGRLRLLAQAGLPIEELMGRGIAPVLTRTDITYRSALKLGDPVQVRMDFVELRSASATLEFQICSGSTVAAAGSQTGLFVDLATGKPRRISPEMRNLLLPFLRTVDDAAS